MGGFTGSKSKLELPNKNRDAIHKDSITGSNLDESQYTYYSESINMSTMHDDGHDLGASQTIAAQEVDVKNIKADIERAEKEEDVKIDPEKVAKRILTERGDKSKKSANQIEVKAAK